jgi:Ca-activated chloride channel family protein
MSESLWNDPRITAYVLDELPAEERDAFELEVQSDAELSAAVEEARSVTGQLADLYALETTPPLEPGRREAILNNESATPRGSAVALADQAATRQGSGKVLLFFLAAAATLLLLVGIAPWLNQQDADRVVMDSSPSGAADKSQASLPPSAPEASSAEVDRLRRSGESVKTDTSRTDDLPMSELSVNAADESAAVALGSDVNHISGGRKIRGLEKEARDSGQASAPADAFEGTIAEGEVSEVTRKIDQAVVVQPRDESMIEVNRDLAIRGSIRTYVVPQSAEPHSGSGPAPTDNFSRAALAPTTPVAGPASNRGVASPVWTLDAESADPATVEFLAERLEANEALSPVELKAQAPVELKAQALSVTTESKPVRRTALAAGRALAQAEQKLTKARADVRFRRSITLGKELTGERDFALLDEQGRGPGIAGDKFDPITDNPFKRVLDHPLSTFSVDVDTASYSKVRDVLLRANQLPRRDAVRIEELVNYFEYDYAPPADDAEHPFAARSDITSCPWNPEHRLARVSLQGKTMTKDERPQCNLVFLLDTSGSMNAANKLPLVIRGMEMLLGELNRNDRVAITVYAGSAGLVLDSTPAKRTKRIRNALTELSAGGSTNGGAGIALAYQTARDHFIADGVNRVILCTDGDFNVGTTSTDELVRMVENEAKGGVYLSVLGFGMGNHNDAMLEKVSGQGNGNYAFIDTENEARKVLVDQTSGTLVTIAKNVKMQVEFNPMHVSSYRLIGYENRVLATEDFNDDKKDAGEIGAGHSVTAFYELVPADAETEPSVPEVDELKFQTERQLTEAADSDVTMTLKLRYLEPDANVDQGDESTLVEVPVVDQGDGFESADLEFRFAAAVAGFGMKLRRSDHSGDWTLQDVLEVAESASGKDKYELRAEFADLVRKASELMGEQ